jgi:serine/threonine-protein kinase
MIGKTISHYNILEEIGCGGMSIVYKVKDLNLKRLVALKFLSPILTAGEENRKRFITEAQSVSALDHPNICTIFDINKTDDYQIFIAMGFYEGETLDHKISHCPLDIQQAINITIQMAEGLSNAHEKCIIHRDIKPANIMITNDGMVNILDFGFAKLSGHPTFTKTGAILGTTVYLSPKQTSGEKVDHRTNIWFQECISIN